MPDNGLDAVADEVGCEPVRRRAAEEACRVRLKILHTKVCRLTQDAY